jgi:hypothetical protein
MTRIPSHTVEDAPAASRALLEDMLQFSPTGRLVNMHAQMAHAPAYLGLTVFTAYFLNYAATELDLPPAVPVASPDSPLVR